MTLELALRATEILLALAFIQQSIEHLSGPARDRPIFAIRLTLSLILLSGAAPAWTSLALCGTSLWLLQRFQGPYNGGSDRMGVLVLLCLTVALWAPEERWRELALGYLALQLTLSYVISGWVKLKEPEWRSGAALRDVFSLSAYPVAEADRRWAERPRALLAASWAVMLFELAFPLALLSPTLLIAALGIAALFHLSNAFFLGLNRFVWVWIAAYPSILWLQSRLMGVEPIAG